MKFVTVNNLTVRTDLISHVHIAKDAKVGEVRFTDGQMVSADAKTIRQLQLTLAKITRTYSA